jgi:hypothetical protein
LPQESQLAHRNVRSTALPYISNQSPTVTDASFISGSSDILTSIKGFAERRPGFADAVEPTPTVFNNLQRIFSWDDFNGNFYVMFCDINASGFAQVFKMQVGVDNSAVSLFTDVSAVPFDFVVSNNTAYFSNGVTAKKWNPTIGVQNWGIAMVNPGVTTSNYVGTGADGGGAHPWSNPTNIQGAPDAAVASVTVAANVTSNNLNGTNYGFTVSTTTVLFITGVQVTITGSQTQGTGANSSALLVALQNSGGIISSNFKSIILPASNGAVTLGGSTDTWGAQLNPTVVNSSTFGVLMKGSGGFSQTKTFNVDAVQITLFITEGPPISVNAGAGTFSATVGYEYVYCYSNSVTGHISSPTLVSASTGVFTNKLEVDVTLVASTDPQVTNIRLFRTTDSAAPGSQGGTFFELPTSPYPNVGAVVADKASDLQLNQFSIAPTPTFNDPPTPGRSAQYFSGRIWLFKNNKVNFSGLEEITNGVPEESFPSGTAGNFWSFDQAVQGEGVAGSGTNQGLGVFCGGRIYAITGNTLDTFRRFQVSNRRGARNLVCVTAIGSTVAWLDSANQIWLTDGNSLQEISIPIRPDLAGIVQANCSMTFHTSGRFHWLVFSTGTKLFVYDVDTDQWMPPWSFSCQYIFSGEISPGNYVLMASIGTKAVKLNPAKFNDNGATYQPIIKTNLMAVVPDFGGRFSYAASGIYDEPSRTGVPWLFEVDNNAQTITDVLILADDDPTQGTYTSIVANLQPPAVAFNRNQGIFLTQNVYPTTAPASRWVSLQIKLANADQVDNIYGWYMAYKPLGGR